MFTESWWYLFAGVCGILSCIARYDLLHTAWRRKGLIFIFHSMCFISKAYLKDNSLHDRGYRHAQTSESRTGIKWVMGLCSFVVAGSRITEVLRSFRYRHDAKSQSVIRARPGPQVCTKDNLDFVAHFVSGNFTDRLGHYPVRHWLLFSRAQWLNTYSLELIGDIVIASSMISCPFLCMFPAARLR